ncbi:MAG: hypothetical protein P8M61_02315 [Crocinitomicaceae bacterium]|nr:hypothetical protein [Crocinitomicaceae bacterium]
MSKVESITFQELLKETTVFFVQLLEHLKKGVLTYWKHSFVLLLIAVGMYFFQVRNTKTFYKAKAAYTFNFIHKKVFGDLILHTSDLNDHQDKKGLSKALKISQKTANSLLSINAKNITSSPLHEDFTDARVPFYLNIEISDTSQLDELQNAFTNYLNEDPTIYTFISKETKDLKKQLVFVKKEVKYLDSLIDNLDEDANLLPFILAKNKENSNEKIRLNNRLSKKQAVSLMSPFKVIQVSRSSQLWKTAVKYGMIWLLLSLSITTFLHWYKSVGNEV